MVLHPMDQGHILLSTLDKLHMLVVASDRWDLLLESVHAGKTKHYPRQTEEDNMLEEDYSNSSRSRMGMAIMQGRSGAVEHSILMADVAVSAMAVVVVMVRLHDRSTLFLVVDPASSTW
jgi:hypothetical protein